ncbi:hypothetical protein BJF93_19325 [Xaviernesmea oryzae]|uniref:DUF2798 domain-containing protein n=1 Tax=Xaviernesmea oryzae TaxID=464029 RepID=A0A1Q9B1F3_9HYPH|nr:DUF2798 domain-containing protein [Xaviernesmea oryzae]OLP61841.1 hypothetical protein BJF93_19325 [Xaviernesmea oryzae]SEL75810.1 Protein of unknown function [Xaviernesmea oryzae]
MTETIATARARAHRLPKLPPRMLPYAFAFFMAAIMAMIMSAVIVGANSGIDAGYPARVLASYQLAAPTAFLAVLTVRPLVSRLVGLVVRLP